MAGKEAAAASSPLRSGAALRAEPGPASEEKAGARPKQRGARIVPSRYLDYQKGSGKAAAKATADPHEVLQSTLVESHGRSRPELEVSAIKSKSCPRASSSKHHLKSTPREKQSLVSPDSDDLIRMLESETLLLTYASLKMEKNTAFLERQSERSLLTLSREAARLQAEAQKKRRRLQRLRKDHQLSESLGRQMICRGPWPPPRKLCAKPCRSTPRKTPRAGASRRSWRRRLWRWLPSCQGPSRTDWTCRLTLAKRPPCAARRSWKMPRGSRG
ncbi:HAUS augmin-like complex subunit 8 isoform X2 [Podarcis raffonei]|uniref:HAUS augmin-like complex subunit 8 isoform X2 n=1 Tax=Podarcis raffonei TaxID=65483 RepID=UPI0023296649|nr:HAUS augmin-like complex subunit 8 isoform X2 [Podarcis raffonei]